MKEVRRQFYDAINVGAAKHGNMVINLEGEYINPLDFDGVVIHGIAGQAGRKMFDDYLAAGKHVLFFDKGYSRDDVLRVSVDSFNPTKYLMKIKRPRDRLQAAGVVLKPTKAYSANDDVILFDGASNKYCQWAKLGDQLVWGQSVIDQIRQHTDRLIIYRPRPSHNKAQYLNGSHTSQLILAVEFKRAHIVMTHGGNLSWDATIAGLPVFQLHDSIADPLANKDWGKLGLPRRPSIEERTQWAANVAYCQWSLAELADGSAWYVIKQQLELTQG